ncbi:MAG: molybdopterin molybdotransferase MoeA [Thermomicrobiales bacterium]
MNDSFPPRVRLDLSVEQARGRLFQRIASKSPCSLPLDSILGLVVAEELVAPFDLPRFTNSAMDGFAVRAADTSRASETAATRLMVAGAVEAGEIWTGTCKPGSAVRISTGAALPNGCDAVVPHETVLERGHEIVLTQPVATGQHVRPTGEDVRAGMPVLSPGTVIRPQEIGLLAALGCETASVIAAPVVSILSIGQELLPSSKPAQVPDANGPMLAAQVQCAGGNVVRVAQSDGDSSGLSELLDDLGQESDLIITSGGISDSTADTMAGLLDGHPEAELWNVRLRPGRHFGFGRFGQAVVLSLPGNPVAAFVGFEFFGRLAIGLLSGRKDDSDRRFALATEPLTGARGRTDVIRGHVRIDSAGQLWIAPTVHRGSGIVSSLLAVNGLAILPESIERIEAGQPVEIRWMGYQ